MKIAYIDCFHGAAGDMLLAALLDAGLELGALERLLATLPLSGYSLEYVPTVSYGISGARLRVNLSEAQPARDWRSIRSLIEASGLPERSKGMALAAFGRLARAEAKIHGVALDDVHFHEVGALDSIVDMLGFCIGLELLGIERVYASPLPSGSGWVNTAHGRLPVPAPATLALCAEAKIPLIPALSTGELVTPTAAALLAELARFEQPAMQPESIGYGFGWKDFGVLNGLRIWIGTSYGTTIASKQHSHQHEHGHDHQHGHDHRHEHRHEHQHEQAKQSDRQQADVSLEELIELRCNIDDSTGELLGYLIERLMSEGALDAWAVPLTMKKGRPAVQLACLVRPQDRERFARLLLRESSSFGVRWNSVQRWAAGRDVVEVQTPWGKVRAKRKWLDGAYIATTPEYEDCAAIARTEHIPLGFVYNCVLNILYQGEYAT